jgi:hypothetical protein
MIDDIFAPAVHPAFAPADAIHTERDSTPVSWFTCPGCGRRLVRDDIRVSAAAGTLAIGLTVPGCSARYEFRVAEDGDIQFVAVRPCIASPLPLFQPETP